MTLIFIPKKDYKEYFIQGIMTGAALDILIVAIFQDLFHIIQFKNQWVFEALGQNALSPFCWLFVTMLYLYFLPEKRLLRFIYYAASGASSVIFGYFVHNANLFDFQPWFYPFFSFVIFTIRWIFVAWVFVRTSPLGREK